MNNQLFKYVGITLFAVILGVAAIVLTARGSGTLIKGESYNSVYYLAQDGKRYVFPNDKTFLSWYDNFDTVQIVTDAELGSISIGGNVTYRPGSKLVKIVTDPKTYAVDKSGTLRWITSEDVAMALYGLEWAKQVDDVPDEFFTNYRVGSPITSASDFLPPQNQTIDMEKGLGGGAVVEEPAEITIPIEEPINDPESIIQPEPVIQPEAPMPYVPQDLHFDRITISAGTWNVNRRLLFAEIDNGAIDGISTVSYQIDETRADGSVYTRIIEVNVSINAGAKGEIIFGPQHPDSTSFKVTNIKVVGMATGSLYTTDLVIEFSL